MDDHPSFEVAQLAKVFPDDSRALLFKYAKEWRAAHGCTGGRQNVRTMQARDNYQSKVVIPAKRETKTVKIDNPGNIANDDALSPALAPYDPNKLYSENELLHICIEFTKQGDAKFAKVAHDFIFGNKQIALEQYKLETDRMVKLHKLDLEAVAAELGKGTPEKTSDGVPEYHRAKCFENSPQVEGFFNFQLNSDGSKTPIPETWQNAFIDYDGDSVTVGCRRCSKTLMHSVKAFEKLYKLREKYPFGKIFVISGKQDQAARIIDVIYENKDVFNSISPFIKRRTKYEIEFIWGAKIEALAPTGASTRGGECLGIITDEAAITKKEAVTALLPSGDTIPEFRFWMCGTPETGGMFHQACMHPEAVGMRKFVILEEMCPWITQTGNRAATRSRLEIFAGEEFAMQELNAVFVQGELIFTPKEVEGAFAMNRSQFPDPAKFSNIVGGIDVGVAEGSAMAGELIGEYEGHWYEIDSFTFKGDKDWEKSCNQMKEWNEKYAPTIYCPTDNGGHNLIERTRRAGCRVLESDWAGLNAVDEKGRFYNNSKSVPISMLKMFLSEEQIHLYSKTLERQLGNYKADKIDDHNCDALLQCCWHTKKRVGVVGSNAG